MRENDMIDRFTCHYVANLFERCPRVLRTTIDIIDLIEAIRRRLSCAVRKELATEVEASTQLPAAARRKLARCLTAGPRGLRSDAESVFRRYHQTCSRLIAHALRRYAGDAPSIDGTAFGARLKDLEECLGLSRLERDALALIHASEVRVGFFSDALYDSAIWDLKNLREYLPALLGVSAPEGRAILSGESPLVRLRLITCEGLGWRPTSPTSIDRFLGAMSEGRTFREHVFERVQPSRLTGRPLNVSDEDWRLLAGVVGELDGCNILLSGAAGTGKTTLATALAAHVGLTPLLVKSPSDADRDERIRNILVALQIAERSPGHVVIIDEAEQVLCTAWSWREWGQKSDKGWLNKLLEQRRAKVIWIANSVGGAEESTLRRFCYSLSFQPFSSRQRLSLWKDVLAGFPKVQSELPDDVVEGLARRFSLQPGQISDAVRIASTVPPSDGGMRQTLERLLRSHQQRLSGKVEAEGEAFTQASGGGSYSLEGLNADQDLCKLTATIGRFATRLWPEGGNGSWDGPKNLNILLSGPPGSGKTEFAKYLARTIDRDLIVKAASELHSKWVGETEKNIAAAFAQAEAGRSVLFIDEADSFLWGREGATASWQVSEVNEFLCRMERFQGILVCATNFMDRFDRAAVRRFSMKVRFDWLAPDGKLAFWDRILAPMLGGEEQYRSGRLPEAERRMLERIPKLGPGDFKVVRQKFALQEQEELTARRLIEELENEARYKTSDGGSDRPIGFLA
jgi:DNA polymerase III delta prime subunit